MEEVETLQSCKTLGTAIAKESDINAFIGLENHAWPPSLALNGIMHHSS
jgi:hypothetical protein